MFSHSLHPIQPLTLVARLSDGGRLELGAVLPRLRPHAYISLVPVLLALGAALLFGLVFGPQWWVRRAMQQHATERPDLPGTGGELARHLLDLAQLEHVPVEIAPADHYDPVANIVRLSPENYDGRSITAVAVAAHEVAHALQHAAGDRLLAARVRFAPVVQGFEFAAAVVMSKRCLDGTFRQAV